MQSHFWTLRDAVSPDRIFIEEDREGTEDPHRELMFVRFPCINEVTDLYLHHHAVVFPALIHSFYREASFREETSQPVACVAEIIVRFFVQFICLWNREQTVAARFQDAEELFDGDPRVREVLKDLRAEDAVDTLVLQGNGFRGTDDIRLPVRIAVESAIRLYVLEERIVAPAAAAADIE